MPIAHRGSERRPKRTSATPELLNREMIRKEVGAVSAEKWNGVPEAGGGRSLSGEEAKSRRGASVGEVNFASFH